MDRWETQDNRTAPAASLRVVMIGPFGLRPRMTMRMRALPLARALVARGHRVTVLLPPWQNPEDAGRAWDEDGVRIENVALPRGVPGWFHWRLTARLVRRTHRLAPDVVHTFKPKAYAGLAHRALRRRYPVVVDTDDWEGPGGWNAVGDYPALLRWTFTRQERWGLAHADAVTAASRALQTLAWSMGGPTDRVLYLPNGTSPLPFTVPPHAPGRPTLLLYTRFFEFGLDRLWRILQAVRDRRPDVRVLVVGRGFAGEEDRLLQMAARAGWRVSTSKGPALEVSEASASDLAYLGWGTPDNLPVAFSAADLALYPFDDTLLNRTKCPVKLLDLLGAGVPVVADAVGEIREMIVDGETGALVPSGDAAAFADAILALLADPERLARMRDRAATDVAARFAWRDLAAVAEKAYTQAISSQRSARKTE